MPVLVLVKEENMTIKCETLRAKDGHPVPVLRSERGVRHLGSLYSGRYAAFVWGKKWLSDRTENLILFGMGDCQILLEAADKVPGKVLVLEPEDKVYQAMKSSNLYKKAVKNKRIHIFSMAELPALEKEVKDLLDDDWVERTMFSMHPGYVGWYEDELARLQQICQTVCDDITFMRAPLKRFMAAMISNQIQNFRIMEQGVPLARLKKDWDPDIPVILVSAGPSLEKNIEELKRVEQRALIWCVDAALPTMLAHDIVPDLVASVDAGKDLACFADPRSKEIPVLASSNTRTEFLTSNQAPKIWGYDHEQIRMMQKRAGIPEAQVPYYLGVSTAMYASAVELGAKKLILIGQDLAFADSGASHVAGRDESAYPVEKIETEGYYGGTVWSRMDWMEFKKWFEKMMDRYPGVKVINATEGGVHLEGSTRETLKQVCDALPSKKHAFRNRLESADNQIHPEEGMKMEEQMYRCGEDIKQIRQWGYHKTFFEEDYRQIPVMDMVLSYMKIVDAEREERFEKALDFVEDQLQKGGFLA